MRAKIEMGLLTLDPFLITVNFVLHRDMTEPNDYVDSNVLLDLPGDRLHKNLTKCRLGCIHSMTMVNLLTQ